MIAYHLATKTIKVKKAQDLKRLMDEEPHLFSGRPTDGCRFCGLFIVVECPPIVV